MNVLVVSHTYISQINRDKWKIFAKQHLDIKIKVIFPNRWPSQLFNHSINEKVLKEESSSQCSFEALPVYFAGNEVRYFYKIKQLITIIKQFNPDIVHVEQGISALSFFEVIALCKILRIKTIFTFFTWINWITTKQTLGDYLFWNHIRSFNKKYSDGAFAGNNDAKKILIQEYFEKSILVLPQLGIDLKTFYPSHEEKATLTKKIGFIGRLVPEKGIFILLEAFTQCIKKHSDWSLVFVGKGSAKEVLEQKIAELNLQSNVTIIPPVPHHEIATILKTFSILALPSYDTPEWKEQFGHVLIEAMTSGVPVIGSDAGEIPNVIENAGIIFKQKNVHDLQSKLKVLIEDHELRKNLIIKAFDRVKKFYTHEAIADATHSFWQSLILARKNS